MKKPEVVELTGEPRETGQVHAVNLRDEKRVPAVLYGPEIKENIHFHISEIALEKILAVSQTMLQELTVNGETYNTLLKRVEFDPVTDRPIHADFYRLHEKRPVTLRVPVHIQGNAIGVIDGGGRVFQPLRIVRIQAIPSSIPAQFEVDISELKIGDSIHVSELEMEGITLIDDPERTIVTIRPPKSDEVFETSAVDETEELAEDEELTEEEAAAEGEEEADQEEGGEGEDEEKKE